MPYPADRPSGDRIDNDLAVGPDRRCKVRLPRVEVEGKELKTWRHSMYSSWTTRLQFGKC